MIANLPNKLGKALLASTATLLVLGWEKVETANPPDAYAKALETSEEAAPAQNNAPDVQISPQPKQVKPAPQTVQSEPAPQSATPRPAKINLAGPQPHFPVKRCINVANALEAPREGEWGYTIRREDLTAIKEAGFDTIRLPVRWDTHMQNRPPYAVHASHFARVKKVIAYAQKEGLGVILDVHHYEDLMTHTRREKEKFLSLWDQIARTFAGASDTVYFEILNEPTNQISMREVNALYRDVIPIIRASNPNRVLILGGNSWNSVDTMDDVAWPNDPNIVATFHDYGPHEFTHQGTPWTGNQWPMGRGWGSRADLAELQDTYDIAARFQSRFNKPIFVGEFGVYDKVPQAARNEWTKKRRQFMERAGYSWCAWDLTGTFTHYDTDTRTWLPGALEALMGD